MNTDQVQHINEKFSSDYEIPDTVEEYLRQVNEISAQTPDIVISLPTTLKPYIPSKHANIFSKQEELSYTLPSTSWSNLIVSDFSKLRETLEKLELGGLRSKSSANRVILPKMKDLNGWHQFLFGETKVVDDEDDDNDENDTLEPAEEEDDITTQVTSLTDSIQQDTNEQQCEIHFNPDGTLPTVELVLQFDQVMTRHLLHYLTTSLPTLPTCHISRCCLWLYALLSHLTNAIHRDEACSIRRLSQVCIQLSQGEPQPCLDVIIVLCGVYYGQLQL